MTNFIAEERNPEAVPGENKVPVCDPTFLSYFGDGTAFSQVFRYGHKTHSERDLLRPGYFDPGLEGGLRKGDEIHYAVGGPEPSDAQRGILVVEECPGKRGVAANAPTIVAIVHRFGRATPVRHGGEALEPETKGGKKAA